MASDRGVAGAMASRLAVRGFAVGAFLLAVTTACTPDQPVTPTPTPSASAATPAETAQEREERLAYEAAETSYREFSAEFRRVTGKGGAKAATLKMKQTAAGPYLASAVKVVKAYRQTGGYTEGSAKFGYLRPAGYSPASVLLDVCEDETSVRTFNSNHKQVSTNGILKLRLDVRLREGAWKVWDYSGDEATTCS